MSFHSSFSLTHSAQIKNRQNSKSLLFTLMSWKKDILLKSLLIILIRIELEMKRILLNPHHREIIQFHYEVNSQRESIVQKIKKFLS